MANSELTEALKKNWYLIAGCVALIAGGIVFGMSGGEDDEVTPLGNENTEFQEVSGDSPTGVSANENFVRNTGGTEREKQASREEKKYLAMLEDPNLSDDEYGLTLFRLANVYYSLLQDYDNAIVYFEQLIDDYPNHARTDEAWRYIADCYKKNGEVGEEIAHYNRMLSKFPEGSKQYNWAREQLQ